jgi:glutamate synthase (NADPH/NADH) small chain
MNLCPRCRRPLEGDESYICCAGIELRWRCADCRKVAEGFAFPYGLCPYCKGRLELLERTDLTDDEALTAVRKAFEIEIGGQAFYARASREAADPELRELFGRFAAMEAEHMALLQRRYHAELPPPAVDFQIDRTALFAGLQRHAEDPAELFRIAIAFEQRAVEFFETEANRPDATDAARELYLELAAEEREHVELLTTECRRWEQGRMGLIAFQQP